MIAPSRTATLKLQSSSLPNKLIVLGRVSPFHSFASVRACNTTSIVRAMSLLLAEWRHRILLLVSQALSNKITVTPSRKSNISPCKTLPHVWWKNDRRSSCLFGVIDPSRAHRVGAGDFAHLQLTTPAHQCNVKGEFRLPAELAALIANAKSRPSWNCHLRMDRLILDTTSCILTANCVPWRSRQRFRAGRSCLRRWRIAATQNLATIANLPHFLDLVEYKLMGFATTMKLKAF